MLKLPQYNKNNFKQDQKNRVSLDAIYSLKMLLFLGVIDGWIYGWVGYLAKLEYNDHLPPSKDNNVSVKIKGEEFLVKYCNMLLYTK